MKWGGYNIMGTITESKKTKLHIAIVLDRSGSMGSIREATGKAFNKQVELLQDEKKDNLETVVSLVTFESHVDLPVFYKLPLDDLKKITCEHYEPCGGTALNDAIATTALRMLNDEDYEETKFLVISITDGDENSSELLPRSGGWHSTNGGDGIKRFIKMLESDGNWTFTYLGANNPKEYFTEHYGASEGNIQIFDATDEGMDRAGDQVSSGLTTYLSSVSSGESSVKNFYQ